jgi:hypothetical protein
MGETIELLTAAEGTMELWAAEETATDEGTTPE